MAQKPVESKVGELEPGNGTDSVLASQEKQLPGALKKTPLRDLHSENNIIAKKAVGNPLVLKEAVITEAAKVFGTKRPSTDSQTSPSHQHSPSGSGANGHLVYVRRKSEAEAGKNNHSEVIADNSNSPQLSIPCEKPSIPVSVGNSNNRTVYEEPQTQPVVSAITSSVHPRVNKQNWEERYLQLQIFLKTLDQSSLEDHLQRLRSLSTVELSRHAVELEKRAIQLSLEQGKELHRVKALNVLGKSTRTLSCNGPPVQQQMPQN